MELDILFGRALGKWEEKNATGIISDRLKNQFATEFATEQK
jgi:hypothetical protein